MGNIGALYSIAALLLGGCVHLPDVSKSERVGVYSCGSIDSELVISLHADGTYEEVFSGGFVALREGEADRGPPKEMKGRGRWEERPDGIILHGSEGTRALKIGSRRGHVALEESVRGGSLRVYVRMP